MQIQAVIDVLQQVAPESLAESWDPVGLHVGRLHDDERSIQTALLAIDLTPAVLQEAMDCQAQLIVSYHPPIFKGLPRLTDADWQQSRILEAAAHQLAVYSPHTALDATVGGVCDWLCDGLLEAIQGASIAGIQPIVAGKKAADKKKLTSKRRAISVKPWPFATTDTPAENKQAATYKVVVFVPIDETQKVRQAMSQAGAGVIGHYRECSFEVQGVGGFRPIDGANPAIGQVGQREQVQENRLEMLVPAEALEDVLAAIHQAHSYEEPAIDVFAQAVAIQTGQPVETLDQANLIAYESKPSVGAGRLLQLDQPVPLATCVEAHCKQLGVPVGQARVVIPEADRMAGHGLNQIMIQTIAVCPGAGGSLFEQVEADLYITGEMRHHDVLDYAQRGKSVILVGHTHTERPYLPVYASKLADIEPKVNWLVSKQDGCPWMTA